jgi:alkylation response protein AidB-like acyl-CoA dehydrogenase
MTPTPEQAMIRDMARRFAQAEIAPHAAAWDRDREVSIDALEAMGRLGFMGMCVPDEWGGAGVDFVSYVLAVEELAAADGGLSNVMCVSNSPVCAALLDFGTDAQKRRFLRPLAAGEKRGAFLLTEPQAGSDAANLETTAERHGEVYVLNGTKQFVTAGQSADIAMIVAVTDPGAGKRGITCFLAPTTDPGYRVARLEEKLGHRTCDTCQIALEDLAVPAGNVLGAPGEGYRIALSYLMQGRIGVAAQAVGMARAAFEAARDYARQRTTFGKPIAEHQAVAFRLADMATRIEVARRMALHAALLVDAGRPGVKEASMAKLYASEMAERVCSDAIQIHGGYGYVSDFPVEKIYRDVRVTRLYEGTSEVQRLVIARELMREGR